MLGMASLGGAPLAALALDDGATTLAPATPQWAPKTVPAASWQPVALPPAA